MDKKKVIIGVIAVLFIAIGAAWAMGYFHRTDPAFAELQQLRDQMRDRPRSRSSRPSRSIPAKDGRSHATISAANSSKAIAANSGKTCARQMNEFFAMSPADQKKRLDEIIDRNIKRQKDRAAQGGGQGGPGGGGGGSVALPEAVVEVAVAIARPRPMASANKRAKVSPRQLRSRRARLNRISSAR